MRSLNNIILILLLQMLLMHYVFAENITSVKTENNVELNANTPSNTNEVKASPLSSKGEVENGINVDSNLTDKLEKTMDDFKRINKEFWKELPLYVIALIIFLFFWVLGNWVSDIKGLYKYLTSNKFIVALLAQIVHLIFIIIGIVIALKLLNKTDLIGTILGAAGVVGLAVGFAVKDTVENYIASILLSLRNPFDVNDYVLIDGYKGNVVRLTSRATILISPDANHVRIPNATVFKSVIVNYTRLPERRFQFDVKISKNEDILHAQVLIIETLDHMDGILKEPSPSVLVSGLVDGGVMLRVYGWIDQRKNSISKVRGSAMRGVKQTLDKNNKVISSENKGSKNKVEIMTPDVKQKVSKQLKTVNDVSVDRTVSDKVEVEHKENPLENLLENDGPKEI